MLRFMQVFGIQSIQPELVRLLGGKKSGQNNMKSEEKHQSLLNLLSICKTVD